MTNYTNTLSAGNFQGAANIGARTSSSNKPKQTDGMDFKKILSASMNNDNRQNDSKTESKEINKPDQDIRSQYDKAKTIASKKESDNVDNEKELEALNENEETADKVITVDDILTILNNLLSNLNSSEISESSDTSNIEGQVIQVLDILSKQSPELQESLLNKLDSNQLQHLSGLINQVEKDLAVNNMNFSIMNSQDNFAISESVEAINQNGATLEELKVIINKILISEKDPERNTSSDVPADEMDGETKDVKAVTTFDNTKVVSNDKNNASQYKVSDDNSSDDSQSERRNSESKLETKNMKTETKQDKVENNSHKTIQKVFQKIVINENVPMINENHNTKPANEVVEQTNIQNVKHVPKAEVIKQIVEKAQVVVGNGASEMDMNLKPDNLGKLNLKVVIEKGLMTAKFVAESQQVKEIIESSFNELRDMLQQKGIEVQGLSVSVGQQGEGYRQNQGFQAWRESLKSNKASVLRVDSDNLISDYNDSTVSVNPYSYHDGNVDYRA